MKHPAAWQAPPRPCIVPHREGGCRWCRTMPFSAGVDASMHARTENLRNPTSADRPYKHCQRLWERVPLVDFLEFLTHVSRDLDESLNRLSFLGKQQMPEHTQTEKTLVYSLAFPTHTVCGGLTVEAAVAPACCCLSHWAFQWRRGKKKKKEHTLTPQVTMM